MAIITPRLMVVEGVTTSYNQNQPHYAGYATQNLSLILLNRLASGSFERNFPKDQEMNLAKILAYAKANEISSLDKDGAVTKIDHKREHTISGGDKYCLGDIITEEEAFKDLKYIEPHIETLCVRIGKLCQEKGGSQDYDQLTPALYEQALIEGAYQALLSGGVLEVVHASRVKEFTLQKTKEKNKGDHPLTLRFFQEGNVVRVACSFFHEQTCKIYEFMTTVP